MPPPSVVGLCGSGINTRSCLLQRMCALCSAHICHRPCCSCCPCRPASSVCRPFPQTSGQLPPSWASLRWTGRESEPPSAQLPSPFFRCCKAVECSATSPQALPSCPAFQPASPPPHPAACSVPGAGSGGGESQKETADQAALAALSSGARLGRPRLCAHFNLPVGLTGRLSPPRAACCTGRLLPGPAAASQTPRLSTPSQKHHRPLPAGEVSFASVPVGLLVLAGGRVVQFRLPEEEGAGSLASSPLAGGFSCFPAAAHRPQLRIRPRDVLLTMLGLALPDMRCGWGGACRTQPRATQRPGSCTLFCFLPACRVSGGYQPVCGQPPHRWDQRCG